MPRIDDTPGDLLRIAGTPPSLIRPPPGCRFAPRCGFATGVCGVESPEMRVWPQGSDVSVACHHSERIGPAP